MALTLKDVPAKHIMVSNILNTYRDATENELEEGMTWYDKAYEACDFMAQTFDYAPGQIAGVMAVVSPGMTWDENESAPARICDLQRQGVHWTDWRGFSTYPANLRKAQMILDGDYGAIRGRKVVSFYGCIMGAKDAVAVDRWAIRVALNDPHIGGDKIVPSGEKSYNAIADAYRTAAELIGITPADCQAVTWTVFRNKHYGRIKSQGVTVAAKVG